MKQFRAFPPDKFIPDSVRPVVDRYVEIRTEAHSSSADIQAKRQKIRDAETADINEAAAILVTGKDVEPGTSNHDAAVKAVHDAERKSRAFNAALPTVAAELKAAYVAASDEVYALADAEFERAKAAYISAIETLAEARKDWLHSVSARRFADDATTGRREADYSAPNIDDSGYDVFRKEVSISDDLLFAPRVEIKGAIHKASIVQRFFIACKVPSYAVGNELTVLDCDGYDKAIEKLQARSSWYVDGDGVRFDTPPKYVTISKVKQITDGMRTQCQWL